MKAMILAAGEGTRLKPLTLETPKVLLPIGGKPYISLALSWLKCHGFTEVAINLYHLGDRIRQFLGNGLAFGVNVIYSPEDTPLGTAGGVKRMEEFFDDTFAVVYGDVFTNLNLGAMLDHHRAKGSMATLAVSQRPNPWELAIVSVNTSNKILDLVEKPPKGSNLGNLANGGIYILEREVLDYIPNDSCCDFAYDVFPTLIGIGAPMYAYVLNHQEYLVDIGTYSGYHQANDHEQGCIPRP